MVTPDRGRGASHSSGLPRPEDRSARLAAGVDVGTRSSSRRRDFSDRAGAGDSD